jgi:hypothetical protein
VGKNLLELITAAAGWSLKDDLTNHPSLDAIVIKIRAWMEMPQAGPLGGSSRLCSLGVTFGGRLDSWHLPIWCVADGVKLANAS